MSEFETATFTFNEIENVKEYTWSYPMNKNIYYCSYCGNKAKEDDIGSTHNHRWEEELIYFCDCDIAKQETYLKEKLAEKNNEVYRIEQEISSLKKLTNNETVNKMKYNNEILKLMIKYNISNVLET